MLILFVDVLECGDAGGPTGMAARASLPRGFHGPGRPWRLRGRPRRYVIRYLETRRDVSCMCMCMCCLLQCHVRDRTSPTPTLTLTLYIHQPQSIRKSFLRRASYEKKLWQGRPNLHKRIHNTSVTDYLHVHEGRYTPSGASALSEPSELAIDHYSIQSIEYFVRTKIGRGAVLDSQFDNVRNWDNFTEYDSNEEYDDELSKFMDKENGSEFGEGSVGKLRKPDKS